MFASTVSKRKTMAKNSISRAITGILIFVIGFTMIPNGSHAQGKFDRANKVFEAGGYYESIDLYRNIYNDIADNSKKPFILFRVAEAFRYIGNARQAELWYEKAIKKEYADPIIYLHYGDVLMIQESYDKALTEYQEYKKLVPNDPTADERIKSCQLAQEWKQSPTGYVVEQVDFTNTKFNDFSPAYGSDDFGILYFTSSRPGTVGNKIHAATGESFTDIFVTERDRKNTWSNPKPVEGEVNTEFEEGSCSLSSDFKTMYFTRCRVNKRDKLGCEILSATDQEGIWGKVEKIPIAGDSVVVAHPSISNDGLTLYFVSDMPGGFGQTDIWKVTRNSPTDTWGEPINLGASINSTGREMFPFVHPDGTLYFSSDGRPGMGGLDIFKASQTKDGGWDVVNMRYPINSSADDFGIVVQKEKEMGYLTSRRKGGRGGDDIYQFYLPPIIFNITGIVKDDKSDKPIAQSTVKLIGSDGTNLSVETGTDGVFKFVLAANNDYVLVSQRNGFLNGKGKETTRGLTESKEFTATLYMASTAKPIELPNIFYDYGRWELRPESMVSLDKLVETLNDNPNITIELGSHTDSRGTDAFNYELSQKRAQSVVDYLIEKGIAPDRLKAKGYAASSPKVVDARIAESYPFLKEGATLTDEYINALQTDEQKEVCHQLNRRTEFKVLSTDYKPVVK